MAKIPHTNTTENIQHIGNTTLWPGDTREVEESLIPGKAPDQEAAPDPTDPIAELLAENKGVIERQIQARDETGRPIIDMEALLTLEAAENATEKPRKGVLSAIAEEKLRRAQELSHAPAPDETA